MLEQRLLVGAGFVDQDYVFCEPDGSPLHPERVTKHSSGEFASTRCRTSLRTGFGTHGRRSPSPTASTREWSRSTSDTHTSRSRCRPTRTSSRRCTTTPPRSSPTWFCPRGEAGPAHFPRRGPCDEIAAAKCAVLRLGDRRSRRSMEVRVGAASSCAGVRSLGSRPAPRSPSVWPSRSPIESTGRSTGATIRRDDAPRAMTSSTAVALRSLMSYPAGHAVTNWSRSVRKPTLSSLRRRFCSASTRVYPSGRYGAKAATMSLGQC